MDYISDEKSFYLKPVIQNGKFGFINDYGEIVFAPTFEDFDGQIPASPYERDGDILVKENDQWGVIDWEKYVVETKYDKILRSKTYEKGHLEYRVYTAQRGTEYDVYDFNGDLVSYSHIDHYSYISGFDSYLAIVKKGNKYGLINVHGKVVLPIEYDKIEEFYGKALKSTKVYKNGKGMIVKFSDLIPENTIYKPYEESSNNSDDYDFYDNLNNNAYNNPHYNDTLDFDQQGPEFWENL